VPAAAVIPAPITYVKVVAVKKLVVVFLGGLAASAERRVDAEPSFRLWAASGLC
jgi:hypothetical protein